MSEENRNKFVKHLAPGVWEDADGNPHFSIPELLARFELEDTPQNRAIATENIKEMIRKYCPKAHIVERPAPD